MDGSIIFGNIQITFSELRCFSYILGVQIASVERFLSPQEVVFFNIIDGGDLFFKTDCLSFSKCGTQMEFVFVDR